MWAGVLCALMSMMCWLFGIICLRGLNIVLLSGVSRKDALCFKEQFDVIAMNKYMSTTMLFPLGGFLSITAILLIAEIPFMRSTVFIVLYSIAAIAIVLLCFYTVTQVLGNRFKRGCDKEQEQNENENTVSYQFGLCPKTEKIYIDKQLVYSYN